MIKKSLSSGVVHKIPKDLETTLTAAPKALDTWEDITPLARNEYICWIQSAKKPETRVKRILWAKDILSAGKRRPCCWEGCKHR